MTTFLEHAERVVSERARGYTDPWKEALRAVGITRPFRWHDLRHTTASSLVIGCWGRAWRLEEIQPLMGHSSITITQIYAHLGADALKAAARATVAAEPVVERDTKPANDTTGCMPAVFVGLAKAVFRGARKLRSVA